MIICYRFKNDDGNKINDELNTTNSGFWASSSLINVPMITKNDPNPAIGNVFRIGIVNWYL